MTPTDRPCTDAVSFRSNRDQPDYGEDTYSWHEAMDRASVLMSSLDDNVTTHPVVESDAELLKLAHAAGDALFALYQAISRKAPHMQRTHDDPMLPSGARHKEARP